MSEVKLVWGKMDHDHREESRCWEQYSKLGTLAEGDSKKAVEDTLSRFFLTQTSILSNSRFDPNAFELGVQLIQMGLKCNIYKIDDSFVLVQSKGGDSLNQEVCRDFSDLSELRQGLIEEGVEPFVPRPFVLSSQGVPAFSVEYLAQHDEVNPYDAGIRVNGEPYIFLIGNSYSNNAGSFNKSLRRFYTSLPHFAIPECSIPFSDLKPSQLYQVSEKFKAEIIARLYVIQQIMGALPKEFSVSAGDFMANFNWRIRDYDPKLITIRGGWDAVPDNLFVEWVQNHQTEVNQEHPLAASLQGLYIFRDLKTISEGIKNGKKMIQRKRWIVGLSF